MRIRFYKGNKTLTITDTNNPEYRLLQLQNQMLLKGQSDSWPFDKGVKWEEYTEDIKKEEPKAEREAPKPKRKRRTKKSKDNG